VTRKRRRDPQREQFWREILAAWQESGQSIRAFCADRGVSEASFFAWRRTLRQRDRQAPPAPPKFVPLHLLADAVLEVVLPSGVVIRVPPGADALLVAALVAALGSTSC
jgi:transposase-like protein